MCFNTCIKSSQNFHSWIHPSCFQTVLFIFFSVQFFSRQKITSRVTAPVLKKKIILCRIVFIYNNGNFEGNCWKGLGSLSLKRGGKKGPISQGGLKFFSMQISITNLKPSLTPPCLLAWFLLKISSLKCALNSIFLIVTFLTCIIFLFISFSTFCVYVMLMQCKRNNFLITSLCKHFFLKNFSFPPDFSFILFSIFHDFFLLFLFANEKGTPKLFFVLRFFFILN